MERKRVGKNCKPVTEGGWELIDATHICEEKTPNWVLPVWVEEAKLPIDET